MKPGFTARHEMNSSEAPTRGGHKNVQPRFPALSITYTNYINSIQSPPLPFTRKLGPQPPFRKANANDAKRPDTDATRHPHPPNLALTQSNTASSHPRLHSRRRRRRIRPHREISLERTLSRWHLEEVFTTEVIGATWRLRRCRLVEEAFGAIDDLDFDPMVDERTESSNAP